MTVTVAIVRKIGPTHMLLAHSRKNWFCTIWVVRVELDVEELYQEHL